MTTEIFNGGPEKLKIRLDELIVANPTLDTTNLIVVALTRGSYLIMYKP